MAFPQRPVAYVLAATHHGSMIVNRFDFAQDQANVRHGVGAQLLSNSAFDPGEVDIALGALDSRHTHFGPGVVAIDGGANLGVHTIEWARHMHGWGRVLAFEAQERVFYALAGNVAINNCWNASVNWSALGESEGFLDIPEPDYLRPGSFGSLELRRRPGTEFIGQPVSYESDDLVRTRMVTVDSLALQRLDFLKIDVEGMEIDVLRGARATLERCKPIVLVEVIKSDERQLSGLLREAGYAHILNTGLNLFAIHATDPSRGDYQFSGDPGAPQANA